MELGFIAGLWWPHIARGAGGFDGCDCLRDSSFPLLCVLVFAPFPWLPRAVNERPALCCAAIVADILSPFGFCFSLATRGIFFFLLFFLEKRTVMITPNERMATRTGLDGKFSLREIRKTLAIFR